MTTMCGCARKSAPPPAPDTRPGFARVDEAEAETLAASLCARVQDLGSWTALRPGLEDSLGYILRRPQGSVCVNRPGLKLTWGQLGDGVAELIGLLPRLDAEPDLLARRFVWFKVMPATLLTGYYEPWLEGSLSPDQEYLYPLYGKPDDLKTVDLGNFHYRWKGQTLTYRIEDDRIVPYHDREAIDGEGVLSDAGKEIAWVKNPVDIFFLQIQGSGRMVLPDGTVRHVLYSGRNGRRFVAIGKLLLRQGIIPREEMSMQRIKRFLNENPEKAKELMFKDPSYVFFTLSDTGPYGAMHSILTPKVSVAVDRTVVPLGSVLALNTALMDYDTGRADPFFSLVLAQDTGGAIKGTRLDLFCGSGDDAEYLAGHLQEEARAFMLVSRRVIDAKDRLKK
jgi:membrane-bound lytic murein transglycosylase A